jgi:outer membrane protein TolC
VPKRDLLRKKAAARARKRRQEMDRARTRVIPHVPADGNYVMGRAQTFAPAGGKVWITVQSTGTTPNSSM